MNPDRPSRDQIEARITALLLGELPAEEAQLLRWTISQDAALEKLQEELARTIVLVRGVEKDPAASDEKQASLKLSDERRQKLLAHFKTPRPPAAKELFWLKRIEVPRLVTALAVVALVAVLAAMMLPALASAKKKAQRISALNDAKMHELQARMDSEQADATLAAIPPPVAAPPAAGTEQRLVSSEAVFQNGNPTDANGNGPQGLKPVVTMRLQEPKLAPPPATEIVLPQAEAAPEVAQSEPSAGFIFAPRPIVESPAPAAPQAPAADDGKLAAALVQDGKQLYEAGRVKESEEKLNEAVTLNPDNASAQYYLNLNKQAEFAQTETAHAADTQQRMAQVEKPWIVPASPVTRSRSLNTLTPSHALDAGENNGDVQFAGGAARGAVSQAEIAGGGGFGGGGRGGGGGGFGGGFGGGGLGGGGFGGGAGGSASPNGGAVVGTVNAFAGSGALRESGSVNGRADQLGIAAPAANGDTFALNDSGADGSRATLQSNNGWSGDDVETRRTGGTSGELTLNYQAGNNVVVSPATSLPVGTFPGASAASDARSTQMQAAQTPAAIGRLDLQGGESFVVQNQSGTGQQFYRSNVGDSGADKVPVLGDMPRLGNAFQSRNALLAPPAPAAAPAGAPGQPAHGFYDDNYSVGALETAKELPKSVGGEMALSGANNHTWGTFDESGTATFSDRAQAGGSGGGNSSQNFGFNLDVGGTRSADQVSRDQEVQTFTLANGDPQEVAAALQKMFQSSSTRNANSPAQNGSVFQQRATSTANSMGAATTSGLSSSAGTLAVDNSGQLNRGQSYNNDGALGAANISVDPVTHNIVVIADKATTDQISKTLGQLDTPLKQILIGDVVMDVSLTNNSVSNSFKVDSNKFYSGLSKDGVNGLRYLSATNAVIAELAAQAPASTPAKAREADRPVQKAPLPAPVPQPEIQTASNAFSTFSLNVSDVSFKLAEASLQNGRMPDAASIRSEEFINAFDYRDPEAAAGQPVAFTSERAQYPFVQNRDLLRFSIKTAAAGRAADRPLNLVLLLDTSGSMERADRVAIIREAMRVLATQLHPQDTVSVVTFARIARLWADGVAGDKASETLSQVGGITPEGGTNLEEAMRLAYETARRHYLANGINRVVLLTDGAANLGNVDTTVLKQKVEAQRKQGIALDCFGIGWEDFNDDMLAELSGNGDGRYAFINTPEEAGTEFAAKLAGALQVAAQDVKVQVEFNPQRVTSWRQIGYAKHQLTKEQFRDNSVLAAEIAAQEAGNALYTVETKPDGSGPVATVFVRYKIPGTEEVQEHSWDVPYAGNAVALEQSSAAMRLAATSSAFSEWLAASPFAQEVSPDELLKDLSGVPEIYGADQRPKKLEWMIRQAKSLSGK